MVYFFSVVLYQISVVTGNLWGAGTAASVYLTIFGERGDTGPRLLYSAKKEQQFQKGKVTTIKKIHLNLFSFFLFFDPLCSF